LAAERLAHLTRGGASAAKENNMNDPAPTDLRLPFRPHENAASLAAVLPSADLLDPDLRARIDSVLRQIGWRDAPDGIRDVILTDPKPSRRNAKALTERLGPLAPIWEPSTGAPALVEAWEGRLAEAREALDAITNEGADRRRKSLDHDRREKARFEQEMRDWARLNGSPRLNQLIEHDQPAAAVYRDERLARDWPAFHVAEPRELDAVRPAARPTEETLTTLKAVGNHASELAEYGESEPVETSLVYVPDDDEDGCHAIRVAKWLGRYTLLGWVPKGDEIAPGPVITRRYPDGIALPGGSHLRPTQYASAWGIRRVAASEALKGAASVVSDELPEMPGWTVGDLLPEELVLPNHPDSDDDLTREQHTILRALSETLSVVAWKLAQPRYLGLSNPAEAIILMALIRQARAQLEIHDQGLTEEAVREADYEIAGLIESEILDLGEVGEILEAGINYDIDLMCRRAVEPAWLSLWVPFHSEAGDPPPTVTDGHELYWSDETGPGGSTLHEEIERRHPTGEARTPAWQLPAEGWSHLPATGPGPRDAACLQTQTGGAVTRLYAPPSLLGGHAAASWRALTSPDLAALDDDDDNRIEQHRVSWEDVLTTLPAEAHPWLVDLIVDDLETTDAWQSSVAAHMLVAGPPGPLRQVADAIAGMARVREDLEEAREDCLLRDPRVTRMGVRHPRFADPEAARFIARARFRLRDDDTPEGAQSRFADALFEFVSLPVSPRMDPAGDGTVVIECGLAVEDLETARDLGHMVIGQVRWHVGVDPVSFDADEDNLDGDEDGGIWFEVEPIDPDD
jgi:hypothetical protein